MWTNILLLVIMLWVCACKVEQPVYTEDIELFKKDKPNARLQLLVGCWLLSRQYTNSSSQAYKMYLIKRCLRKITRKQSVLKITQLIGKNMEKPNNYTEIVPVDQIPVEGGNGYSIELSDFDNHLLNMIKNYQADLASVRGKQGQSIKQKIEQQLKKRTKYYFGIIPANDFTHMLMLISIALLIVTMCTCWKYYNKRTQKSQQKQNNSYFKKNKGTFTKSPTKNKKN